MRIVDGFGGILGALVMLAALAISMYLSATGVAVASWTPFVWSTIIGLVVLGWTHSETAQWAQAIAAVLLLLGVVAGSMYCAATGLTPSTWTPFVWAGIIGLVAGGNSFSNLREVEAEKAKAREAFKQTRDSQLSTDRQLSKERKDEDSGEKPFQPPKG